MEDREWCRRIYTDAAWFEDLASRADGCQQVIDEGSPPGKFVRCAPLQDAAVVKGRAGKNLDHANAG